jgi:hypothetical protein
MSRKEKIKCYNKRLLWNLKEKMFKTFFPILATFKPIIVTQRISVLWHVPLRNTWTIEIRFYWRIPGFLEKKTSKIDKVTQKPYRKKQSYNFLALIMSQVTKGHCEGWDKIYASLQGLSHDYFLSEFFFAFFSSVRIDLFSC